jgi:DNA-binding NtrC family response regulator
MSHPKSQIDPPESKQEPLVYLVDDQPVLLDLAEIALKELSLKPRKFTDPEVALKEFARAKVKPALLITDYAMGKMNGLELIERCQKLHPPLRSVIISGTAGAEILLGAPARVDEFLSKPYPYEQLTALVQRLLAL